MITGIEGPLFESQSHVIVFQPIKLRGTIYPIIVWYTAPLASINLAVKHRFSFLKNFPSLFLLPQSRGDMFGDMFVFLAVSLSVRQLRYSKYFKFVLDPSYVPGY